MFAHSGIFATVEVKNYHLCKSSVGQRSVKNDRKWRTKVIL